MLNRHLAAPGQIEVADPANVPRKTGLRGIHDLTLPFGEYGFLLLPTLTVIHSGRQDQ
jgi:hypothetical protein